MKSCLIILLIFISASSFSQTKEVCFTIDDLPVVDYGINDDDYLLGITRHLISTFDAYQIPAIGFVNESKLYQQGTLDSQQLELLELWLRHGYELGNHTYAHLDFHRVSFADFTHDILEGEKVIKPLMQDYEKKLAYFRHPFLRIGNTKQQHDSLNYFLRQHGYTEAPVTIDNDDYLFAKAFHVALVQDDTVLMKKIGHDYVAYMESKIKYFERSSAELFGRNIKHILLLHANKLNAEYLDDLAAMYKRNGYSFVSLQEALTDQAYLQEISRYGDWGISWIDRWAMSMGKKGDFFKDDPQTPGYIIELAK